MTKEEKQFLEKVNSQSLQENIVFYINNKKSAALRNRIKKSDNDLDELRNITSYLNIRFKNLKQEIDLRCWHVYNNVKELPKCKICGVSVDFIDINKGYKNICKSKSCLKEYTNIKRKQTFIDKYGVENPSNIKEVQEKRKQTFIDKYGVENAYQLNEVKDKIKETNLERYGVENPQQNKEINTRTKQTNLNKYGVENVSQCDIIKQKKIETSRKNYGTDYPWQTKEIRKKVQDIFDEKYNGHPLRVQEFLDKRINTSLERYGSNHPMQNKEVFEKCMKSGFKYKDYILPSGKIVKVQGFEPLCLDELFKLGYLESDILTDTKDIEKYIGKVMYKTNDGKLHRYFPDIYIISENKILEVKSKYTYNLDLEINLLKMSACINNDINFEFKIME